VYYSGKFSGDFYGGTFISGEFDNAIFWDGVYFGGLYTTITPDVSSTILYNMTINMNQYDDVIGLTTLNGYTTFDSQYKTTDTLHLLANVQPGFNTIATGLIFLNEWYQTNTTQYITLDIINLSTNNITCEINNANSLNSVNYIQSDPLNNIPNGNPFLCNKFVGDFKSGIWMHGYFESGNFNGAWINGYALSINYGN
jgi:hypothetical protein